MSTLEKLIYGTEALNRMRSEIKSVIKTVKSSLDRIGHDLQGGDTITHETPSGEIWQIWTHVTTREIDIELTSSDGMRLVGTADDKENLSLTTKSVKCVYQNLNYFLDWIFEEIPQLATYLKPVLEAAEP